MKKIIALLLSLLLLLSMSACGGEAGDATGSAGDTPSTVPTTQAVPDTTAAPVSRIGESIFLGSYEQDNDLENGKEPIEWVIIGESENGYWVRSKYVLDYKYFHHEKEKGLSWETSDIRAWLNGEFYEESFTDAEKAQILLTTVDNSEDTEFLYEDEASFSGHKPVGYLQGNDTQDYIYLLSDYEHRQFIYQLVLEQGVNDAKLFYVPKTPSTAYSCAVAMESVPDGDRISANKGMCTCLTRTLTDNETCEANGRDTGKDCVYVDDRTCSRSRNDYWRHPYGIQPVMWISN